jgi:hypothetical protein
VFITPFGEPVVPPVADRTTTSSRATSTFGRVAGWSAIQSCSERAPGTSGAAPSMQIQVLTLGSCGFRPATTDANSCWKNSTSQSNASRTKWFSAAGLRAPTGIQHIPARHSPSVQAQAVTSLPAHTAPFVSRSNPSASSAFAIRQDNWPTSSKL